MAALLLIQPLLDVLSYFMRETGATTVTTALRTVLLAAVSLYGFVISDRKQFYAAGFALIGGFWLLHMLNCLRMGYAHPLWDTAEYLKLVQFPLWTMAFLTFFRKRDGLDMEVLGILALNFGVILLVIGLSYLTGRTAYTYEFPERGVQLGVLGWFGVPNAQSAVLSLLVPAVVLWGLRTEKLWLFSLCAGLGFGLLYLTGTRLTFYTAVLAAAAFLVLILICRKPLVFCLPMAVILVLLFSLKGVSPMEQRQKISAVSFATYQEKIDAVMGEDKDFAYQEGQEIPAEVLRKIEKVYTGIYGRRGVYGEVLLGDLLDRYGTDKIMRTFDYSIRPQVLNNSRTRKLKALGLVWEEADFLTHLLGVEYSDAVIGGHNYDPENDFPALLYYTGYLGTALYGAFVLGILGYAAAAFFRRFPSLMTPEFGTAAMMFALALGAAQLSGQVLRKPNVTVYFSLAAAMLVNRARESRPPAQLRPGHPGTPAVQLKKPQPTLRPYARGSFGLKSQRKTRLRFCGGPALCGDHDEIIAKPHPKEAVRYRAGPAGDSALDGRALLLSQPAGE